jgi:membrane protease YdiL (CAAX protease family)
VRSILYLISVNLRRRLKWEVSQKVITVFVLSVLGCAGVIVLQWTLNHWIYSPANYINVECTEEGCKTALAYTKFIQILIGSPIIEEVILRIILFTLFASRTGDVLFSIITTNLCFSLLHIVNVMSDTSSFYNVFQVLMALLIGMFYSTRYYITGNAIEVILLHGINNLFASLVPISITGADLYPWFYFPSTI